ncbi:hypothetical protein SK128_023423, partial [Halocaridina rubra]
MESKSNTHENIFLTNAQKFLLPSGLCCDLSLYHIESIIYNETGKEDAVTCEDRKLSLRLYNVAIDQIPPNLVALSMEKSRILRMSTNQPYLKRIKMDNSHIQELRLNVSHDEQSDVRFDNSVIANVTELRLSGKVNFHLTDSLVEDISPSAFSVQESAMVHIERTRFIKTGNIRSSQSHEAYVQLQDNFGLIRIYHEPSEKQSNCSSKLQIC